MQNLTYSRYLLSSIPEFNNITDDANNSNILKLNKVDCSTSNQSKYTIVRYDKNLLCYDLIPTYGLCRSVIMNINNKVVSFAPPKSIQCDEFIKRYSSDMSNVTAEEFVDGTMINVFWDDSIGITGSWEIATRNSVGATSIFFKGATAKTFRKMFLEAASENGLILDNLNKQYCYSFVLQHPENRIVVPYKTPQLYLVGLYSIHYEDQNVFINAYDVQGFMDFFKETRVKFPKVYKFEKYSELIDQYASMNTSYDVVGVVLHNKSEGVRSKIRNPVYEQVRNLRGNQPKLQYQYLCLRKEGRVKDFLQYYPENKQEFTTFRDQVHLFTNTLLSNYISCYIKKDRPLKEFSDQYRTHMYTLHQFFINDLREKKLFVNNSFVIKYVNELHPSLLMYCLNYQMRKRNVDTIVADESA
jgi:hypothetical protein